MKIIDAHHHLWCPVSGDTRLGRTGGVGYTWLKDIGAMKPFGDPTDIQRDYLIDEFRSESTKHELVASVHVQCDGGISEPVLETKWIDLISKDLGANDESGDGVGIVSVGFVDLTKKDALSQLERHADYDTFRGIRQIIGWLAKRPDLSFCREDYLKNKTWQKNYQWFSEFGDYSFDLQLYPEQMSAAADFFAKYEKTPVVIDHTGSPYELDLKGFKAWEKNIELLASLSHISIKLSGWGMYNMDWSASTIKDYYEAIHDLFGKNRMMFGSNYPVDKLTKPYDDIIFELDCLVKEEDKRAIFLETAKKFYRI